MPGVLDHKLARARRRHDVVALASGVCAFGTIFLGVLALAALLDWYSSLSFINRVALLAMNLAVAGYLLFTRGLRPVLRGPSHEELALAVERSEPAFGTRLIASIQLSRPGSLAAGWSPSLVVALIGQTEAIAERIDFSRVVATDHLRRFATFAGAMLMAWMFFFFVTPATAATLLQRALLFPNVAPVHRTTITSVTGDLIIPRGADLTVFADAKGKLPEAGRLLLTHGNGAITELSLERMDSNPHRYQRSLSNVTESFGYTIQINDAETALHRIEVRSRPTIQSIAFLQFLPAYTHLSPIERGASDLILLAGSKLHISLRSTSPLASAGNKLHLVGANVTIPLLRDPGDATRVSSPSFEVPTSTTGLSVELLDDHGIASADSPVYPVQIVPDRPPQIRITSPAFPQTLITPAATVPVGFDASDDVALGKVLLHYQVKPSPAQSIEIDLKGTPKTLRGFYPWKPGGSVNTTIEFWLEARDTNDLTGPGVAESEHFELRVVSEEAKRADLMNRMTDNFRQLDEVKQSEQELNSQLGQVLTEKSLGR